MDHVSKSNHANEIVSLNADDLEVEELERRLELAVLMPMDVGTVHWDCNGFTCGGMTQCSNLGGCRGFKVETRTLPQ